MENEEQLAQVRRQARQVYLEALMVAVFLTLLGLALAR
jgi:hypothetical protein